MSEDPRHPWGSGATRFDWVPEVGRIVHRVHTKWPRSSCNTYVCHPWCGWSRFSFDVWGPGGRGDPIRGDMPYQIRRYLMALPGRPLIRHTILEHQLWTSWGGYSVWAPYDHSGGLRHLHVTYWRR